MIQKFIQKQYLHLSEKRIDRSVKDVDEIYKLGDIPITQGSRFSVVALIEKLNVFILVFACFSFKRKIVYP